MAVVFVHPDAELVDRLKKLANYVCSRELRIRCLYADKQFATIPLMRHLLTETDLSAILAMPAGATGGCEGVVLGSMQLSHRAYLRDRLYGQLTITMGLDRAVKEEHGRRTVTWCMP